MIHIDSVIFYLRDNDPGQVGVLRRKSQEPTHKDAFEMLWDCQLPRAKREEFWDTSTDQNDEWREDRQWLSLSGAVELWKELLP
jgi:hypothetical protein